MIARDCTHCGQRTWAEPEDSFGCPKCNQTFFLPLRPKPEYTYRPEPRTSTQKRAQMAYSWGMGTHKAKNFFTPDGA